jgi:phosphoenolpyruvate synthase/pyruvate phosphate dikinase
MMEVINCSADDSKRQRSNEFIRDIRNRCRMEDVGGKAFNISQMARKGLNVPCGFCITTEAYTYFVKFNRIEEDENIADRIRDGVIPPDLEQSLLTAYPTVSLLPESTAYQQ